jgi:hypothetical protein
MADCRTYYGGEAGFGGTFVPVRVCTESSQEKSSEVKVKETKPTLSAAEAYQLLLQIIAETMRGSIKTGYPTNKTCNRVWTGDTGFGGNHATQCK